MEVLRLSSSSLDIKTKNNNASEETMALTNLLSKDSTIETVSAGSCDRNLESTSTPHPQHHASSESSDFFKSQETDQLLGTPSTVVSPDFQSTSRDRVRSLSDSWQVWESISPLVSPLLSPASWFERSGSFQSFGDSSIRRAQAVSLASQESRRLVQHYDATKPQTLQQHEQYKQSKWGEDRLCDVDLDTSDIDIDLSLADSIKVFPFTDSLAQCVRSYANFFPFRRRPTRPAASGGSCGLPTLMENTISLEEQNDSIDRKDDKDIFNSTTPPPSSFCKQVSYQNTGTDAASGSNVSALNIESNYNNGNNVAKVGTLYGTSAVEPMRTTGSPSSSHRLEQFPGELAVPNAVQEALDTILSWYRSNSFGLFSLPPSCPRRRIDVDLSCPKRSAGCPRRKTSKKRHKSTS